MLMLLLLLSLRERLCDTGKSAGAAAVTSRMASSRQPIIHKRVPLGGAFQSVTGCDGGRLYLSVADEEDVLTSTSSCRASAGQIPAESGQHGQRRQLLNTPYQHLKEAAEKEVSRVMQAYYLTSIIIT